MKYILLFFTFVFVVNAQAGENCKVTLNDLIIYTGNLKSKTTKNIFKTDCSDNLSNKFRDIIGKFNGPLRASYLQTAFKKDLKETRLSISPRVFQFWSLNSYLQNHLDLPDNKVIKDGKFLGLKEVINLSNDHNVHVTCRDCKDVGEKNIKLTITNISNGTEKILWAKAHVYAKVEALVSKVDLGVTNRALLPTDFKKKIILSKKPASLFKDKQGLVFFKVNRPLPSDAPLYREQLSPMKLVKRGTPTKVILKNGPLKLEGTALPLVPGSYGEQVKLKNPNSQRVIMGKVIDFNKVEVEL